MSPHNPLNDALAYSQTGYDPKLYLVLGGLDCRHLPIEQVIEFALKGGVKTVQLRDKDCDDATYCALGVKIAPIVHAHKARFLLNDRAHLIDACGADGCHLGQGDMPISIARQRYQQQEHLIFGLSIGSLAERSASQASGDLEQADYIALGPAFATQSKADAGQALGVSGLRTLAQGLTKPLVAIGGITPNNAASLVHAGFSSLAVISAIAGHEQPQIAAQQLSLICNIDQ